MAVEKSLAYELRRSIRMYQSTYSELDMEIDTGTDLTRDYTPRVSVCYGDEKHTELDQDKKKGTQTSTVRDSYSQLMTRRRVCANISYCRLIKQMHLRRGTVSS